eukprot:g8071.t1
MIAYVPRLPSLGETLHGSRFALGFGGKGANQAVAAAKLGGHVAMVTKVGRDSFGADTRANFDRHGVGVEHVLTAAESDPAAAQATGVAPISVDADGNNSIVIVMGANDALVPADVDAAAGTIAAAELLVCQLEVPAAVSLHALRLAREFGVRTLLNTAPAPAPGGAAAELADELLAAADILCPNEHEAALLTGGMPVGTDAEAEAAARELAARGAAGGGCRHVVLTLGGRGVLWLDAERDAVIKVEPTADRPVDTVGAGDAFVGALAHFLTAGARGDACGELSFEEAVRRANVVAGASVTRPGTQTSFFERGELPPAIFAPPA